ncbi:MAG: hypothetical protein AAFQ67_04425 [Pseudomonadota bacterium]
MDESDIDQISKKASETGLLSEDEARTVMRKVYRDGVVSRVEADALFALNDKLFGWAPLWDQFFRGAVKDFVLDAGVPKGWVSEDESDWLIDRITRDGEARYETEIDALLDILRFADGAPERLGAFALTAITDRIRQDGRVQAKELDRLRRALHAPCSEGAVWVTRREAEALFELNDAVASAQNETGWNDLFARAIANHLMALAHPSPSNEADALKRDAWLAEDTAGVTAFLGRMATSFGQGGWFDKVAYNAKAASEAREAARDAAARAAEKVDAAENAWIRERLRQDQTISPAERALIAFLHDAAPGLADGLAAAA